MKTYEGAVKAAKKQALTAKYAVGIFFDPYTAEFFLKSVRHSPGDAIDVIFP